MPGNQLGLSRIPLTAFVAWNGNITIPLHFLHIWFPSIISSREQSWIYHGITYWTLQWNILEWAAAQMSHNLVDRDFFSWCTDNNSRNFVGTKDVVSLLVKVQICVKYHQVIWCFSSFALGALDLFPFDFLHQLKRLGKRANVLDDLVQFMKQSINGTFLLFVVFPFLKSHFRIQDIKLTVAWTFTRFMMKEANTGVGWIVQFEGISAFTWWGVKVGVEAGEGQGVFELRIFSQKCLASG